MWTKPIEWLKQRLRPKPAVQILVPIPERKPVDTAAIRARIQHLGWTTKELPIRKSNPDTKSQQEVTGWKLIASNGERSAQVNGKTLDDAMRSLGIVLGVIPRG